MSEFYLEWVCPYCDADNEHDKNNPLPCRDCGEEVEIECCRGCGRITRVEDEPVDTDAADGYDGYCGSCADRAEARGEWEYD